MNETTVRTEDYKVQDRKSLRYYTTSDKLYAPGGDPNGKDYYHIYVGSKNSKLDLDMGTYWSSGNDFWLRSPDYSNNYSATSNLYVYMGWRAVKTNRTNGHSRLRPASNIDLSNVLFASAASASTRATQPELGAKVTADDITDDAMSLRLNGSDKGIGSVFYSSSDNTVTAIKGDTDEKVSLIIQGKTNDKDWYISETISGYYKLNLDKESGYDISQCKIWLEIPVDDSSTLAYAVEATEHEHKFGDDWTNADGVHHWKECLEADCPDPDKGKNETIEDHNLTWHHTDDEHYMKCSVCELDDSIQEDTRAAHKLNADGVCETCGYDMNEEHNFEHVQAKDASCTTAGNKEYWKCKDTGCELKYHTVLGLPIRFTVLTESNVLIPATGHTIGEFAHDSINHWNVCSTCGAKLEDTVGAHTFRGNKCTVCGYYNSRGNSSGGSSGGSGGSGSTSSSAAGSITGVSNVSGTWTKDSTGWKYELADGTYAAGSSENSTDGNAGEKISWVKINNVDYAFGYDGYLRSGWVLDSTDGKWYYCDENKGRLYGWFYDTTGDYWYYMDANTGNMLTGWQLINGKQYYFAPAPEAATYTFDAASSKWVYNNAANNRPYGSMYSNAVTPDNHQVDADGARIQ